MMCDVVLWCSLMRQGTKVTYIRKVDTPQTKRKRNRMNDEVESPVVLSGTGSIGRKVGSGKQLASPPLLAAAAIHPSAAQIAVPQATNNEAHYTLLVAGSVIEERQCFVCF